MQNITVTFNKESFNRDSVTDSIKLCSTFKYDDPIEIHSSIQNLNFKNRNELIAVFEKIRGTEVNDLKLKFFELDYREWALANFYEQQAFKSLVLIYHWLELSLSNPHDLDVKTNLYNEFIVDWNYTPRVQNTIYLINENYIIDSGNKPLLEKLVDVNLLCRINIVTELEQLTNYFIPLLTPGVSIEYLKSNSDSDGSKTNKLWKTLLNERNKRINNWVTNRF
ncbi:hypothetical protein ACHRV1_25040 [Flavobacterium aquidurense]|uniref:Uncharacterized protein n=2 Tax=Flavobacterium TaxID=237 RepID=A0A7W7IW82_9FLAO|nr:MULTISPECIES: hypothetical protein [Flavobacterium]MBB4801667.1 hypothetical protein [Flavobacterium nitrogenifigens]MBB6386625.1 hypothetical protein [Flavobacterium notoginsengisoli]